jgi:hypothetical protein
MFYDLASTTWGDEELDAIQRVIDSDRFTMGDHVRRFEEAFASHFGMKHAVMVNSGSSANLVAVAALNTEVQRAPDPLDVHADHARALPLAAEGRHREPRQVAHLAVVALPDRSLDLAPQVVEVDALRLPGSAVSFRPRSTA